ncbi:amino acid adenylation domain-containing protein, partial [Dyella mobilis]
GLLAILKAGGAYVPLDPVYSSDRLSLILRDAQPRLLLCDVAGRQALGEEALASLRVIDLDAPRWSAQPHTNPVLPALASHHLAYVIYTSGSTGTPKGVMVEHRQFTNLIDWHAHRFGLRPGDRHTLMAGMAFDASAWELWPALAMGGILLVPPRTVSKNPLATLQWWKEQAVDISFLITPLALLAASKDLIPSTLKHLLIGGEDLPQVPVLPRHDIVLVNNYGPTETTVVATSCTLIAGEMPTIGRPIANTRIYLLDAHRQPVPLGAVGELYIGGAGVARGYLNRPELTAERFLPDPFSPHPDARMYRSGDLARYLPDGNLVFLGRNDHQVKIRG